MNNNEVEPLAYKLRPNKLKNFIGQKHLVNKGKPIYNAIKNKNIFSFILWGPPGVGKTTLAKIYTNSILADLYELSAVSANKDDIRKIINQQPQLNSKSVKVLFLDEIHRFNKAQQDFLLPYVEKGKLILIGATTENPSFEIIPALLSRCRIFVLNTLSASELRTIIKKTGIEISSNASKFLIEMSNGDARVVLTAIDNTLNLYGEVNEENLKNTFQNGFIRFDKKGEEHYDVISAFIKSLRSSDSNGALYYLSRMIYGGEDPKFIARRMIIFASEDIGVAQPTALVVANEVFRAVETVGLPEASINLAHGAVYLATAKKDRSIYNAFLSATEDVKQFGNLPIPLEIRNAPKKLMKDLNYSKGYKKYDLKTRLPVKLRNKKYLK